MQPDRSVILNFLSKLPVRKIPSVGGMTETTLKELGIETGKDLLDHAPDIIVAYNNHPKMHEFLIRRSLGIAHDRHTDEESERKGISIS